MYLRLMRRLFLMLSIALLLSTIPISNARMQEDQICFEEGTGFCIAGRIREFWQQNGGLPIFGFPIGVQREEIVEDIPFQVQWFERGRLELHPENAPPYDVLLGRLGDDRLRQQGRDWTTFLKSEPQADCRFFPETGHNVCGDFLAYWQSNGLEFDGFGGIGEEESRRLFGLPLSDAQSETIEGKEYTVQWFERARFELHPENAPPYHVLLGLLGTELHGIDPRPAGGQPSPADGTSPQAHYIFYFFFAPEGCPFCRGMAPVVQQFYTRHGGGTAPPDTEPPDFTAFIPPLACDAPSLEYYAVPIRPGNVGSFTKATGLTMPIGQNPGLPINLASHPVTALYNPSTGESIELSRGQVPLSTLEGQVADAICGRPSSPANGPVCAH